MYSSSDNSILSIFTEIRVVVTNTVWPALQKHAVAVRRLESEKCGIQREMGSILANEPRGPTASTLPVKLSVADHKIDHINSLIDSFKKK